MIVSHGHSGSTLVDKVLGNHRDSFSTGEILHFSRLSRSKEVYCGCSELYSNCHFWQNICEEFSTELDIKKSEIKTTANTYINLINRKTLLKDLINVLANILSRGRFLRKKDKNALRFTDQLFKIISSQTSCNILIDSSKRIDRALFFKYSYANYYDVKILHLVRDGRSVLGSFHRKHIKIELNNNNENENEQKTILKEKKLPAAFRIILSWTLLNIYISFLSRLFPSTDRLTISYENFTANPDQVCKEIMDEFEIPFDPKMTDLRDSINHMVGGHAARINARTIKPSEPTWQKSVPKKTIKQFQVYAGWLNRIYGYM